MLTIVSRVGFASPRSISLIRARRVSASSAKSVWDNFEESLNSSTFRPRLS
jgi:glucuronate isomerase